jgi:hypothetical protein
VSDVSEIPQQCDQRLLIKGKHQLFSERLIGRDSGAKQTGLR